VPLCVGLVPLCVGYVHGAGTLLFLFSPAACQFGENSFNVFIVLRRQAILQTFV